jgi:import inner membrane translocase subunit TIM9|tara:strand:- start:3596 stop:3832 length:237 start_codon:yes stop_codon:yes gene_type:complete|eukprot:30828-Pelagococcus_subviridis.AAC.33
MDPNQQMQGISPEDEKRMATMIEGMQTRDSLRMYNNLVEKCFDTCVQSFRRKTLEKDEERVRAFLDRPRTQISFPNLR